MQLLWFILFFIAAFWLGACPFAVWIGRYRLHKDIREYGDSNPGAANVFKAGSIKWGFLAVLVEILKGMPFVFLAIYLGLPLPQVYFIGLCAILGHAFSPFLGFKGGKATAVTFGVLIAIPPKEIVVVFFILMLAGFFFLAGDGWRMVLSIAGCLLYATLTDMDFWTLLFLIGVLIIVAVKNAEALRSMPRAKEKIYIGFGRK